MPLASFDLKVNALVPRFDWVKPASILGADRWGTLFVAPLLDLDLALSPLEQLEQVTQAIRACQQADELSDSPIISLELRRAIREQRKVNIAYADEQGKLSNRTIWPIAISYYEAQRLVVGWCELREDFRSFRADRMLAAEVLKDRYGERRKALLKRWLEQETGSGRDVQADVLM